MLATQTDPDMRPLTPSVGRRSRQRLADSLAEIDFVLPGSIVVRHTRCGTPRCRCKADPPSCTAPTSPGPARSRARLSPGYSAPTSWSATRPASTTPGAYASSSPNSRPSRYKPSSTPKDGPPSREHKRQPPPISGRRGPQIDILRQPDNRSLG